MTYTEIHAQLLRLQDPERAALARRFFKTGKGEYGYGDTFLGISVPSCRAIAKQYKDISLTDITKLLHDSYHECRLTALILLCQTFARTKDTSIQKQIVELYLSQTAYINNWDLVDTSAYKILGVYLRDKTDRSILYTLAKSTVMWERRIAIVATLGLISVKDIDDALKLAELLLTDTHDLMHKAVGWVLREVGKKNKPALIAFLDAHTPNMPRTTLRYAIEKCSAEEKKYYMHL